MSDLRPTDTTDAPAHTAPQRRLLPAGGGRAVDKLRPWALRQAARTYAHLPELDREGAVDAALRDVAARGVADDARAARFAVADDLTQRLRAAHVAWCHRPSAMDAPPTTPDAPATVTDVVERGLGGLERAVLQLEIGAGHDTRTSRAALRLSPRDYTRHRREGLAKLRAAVGGQVAGHVCATHAEDVVLAATGDDAAAERLGAGRGRCRACAREAQGLRRLLHQRLGLAPWPLTVKPMGILAAKLAGLGGGAAGASAVAGSSATSSGGVFGALTSGVTGAVATAASVAAVAGGTFIVTDGRGADAAESAARQSRQAHATTTAVPTVATPAPTAAARAAAPRQRRAATSKRRTGSRAAASKPAAPTPAAAPAATATPAPTRAPVTSTTAAGPAATAATPEPAGSGTSGVSGLATEVSDTLSGVTAPITGALPRPVGQPVQEAVDGVGGVLDGVGATVDGFLQPKP